MDDQTALLKEIRDGLREDFEWRRRAVEESIEIQKKAVRFQRIGLLIVLGAAALGALFLLRYALPR
jgi:hypothetical protein